MKTRLKAAEAPKVGKRKINFALLDLYGACLKNADHLMQEADLLLSHGHHARAFYLAFTAFEELGKSQLVADYFNELISDAEYRAAFHDHRIKAAYVERYVTIPKNQRDTWFIEYDKQALSTEISYRMRSLYVEAGNNFNPLLPEDAISIDLAKKTVAEARRFLEEILRMEYLTERIGTKAFTK